MKKFLFLFALAGWILGLTVHLLTVAHVDVESKVPYIWVLHIGIFVVWLPAILHLRKNKELLELEKSGTMNRMNPFGTFNIMFKDAPKWIAVIAYIGFFYAVTNFMLTMFSVPGSPEIENGQYILENRGHHIRTITAKEYHYYNAQKVRGFSGHWMAFYGIAATILYPFKKKTTG